jgi:hypothetical protein
MKSFFKKIGGRRKKDKIKKESVFEMGETGSGPVAIDDDYFGSFSDNDNNDYNYDYDDDLIDNILNDKADDIILIGYMFKKGFGKFMRKTGLKISEEPWKRLYFSLSKKGELRYYHNKKDYLSKGEGNSIKSRAIIVSDYKVVHLVKDIENRQLLAEKNITDEDISGSLTSMGNSSIAGTPLFMPSSNDSFKNKQSLSFDFMLVPYDNNLKDWTFRVDTTEELDLWVENLSLFSKTN